MFRTFALRSDGRRYCDPSMMFSPQLCYSGKLTDVIAEDALAIIRNQPPASRGVPGKEWSPSEHLPGVVFGMMPQDAWQNCRCEACSKELATLQSTSNFMWRKTAEVAGRIKKELGRGYVSQMAYYPYHLVPETDIPDRGDTSPKGLTTDHETTSCYSVAGGCRCHPVSFCGGATAESFPYLLDA